MKTKNTGAGFTLVECVIVILVVGVISSVLAVIILKGVGAFDSIVTRGSLMEEAEFSMEKMTREIRNIRSVAEIAEADSDRFRFIDVNGHDITYSTENSMLVRNGKMVSGNLHFLGFSYFDSGGGSLIPPVENPGGIRAVEVELIFSRRRWEVGIETRVRPRNSPGGF